MPNLNALADEVERLEGARHGSRISPEVADVLARSTIDGVVLRLPAGQLARPLYAATDKVITMLGGKWDRRKGGHIFPFDPTPKLEAALSSGKIVSRQQRLQLFETPVQLADYLVGKLGNIEGLSCLEPSAGRGRIAHALALRDPDWLCAVEIDPDNVSDLRSQNLCHEIRTGDFLDQSPDALKCDAVAMNPPFTRNQDIRHVRHAFECLRAGGCLAAIVSEHGFIGQERECVEWREWLADMRADIEEVPAGTFKESGTSVATRLIVIRALSRLSQAGEG